jgi:hypothetical protein
MAHALPNTVRMPAARALAGALLVTCLLTGGTCHVSYCHDHCDPCAEICDCDKTCARAASTDPAELFGLARYVLVTDVAEDGSWSRSYRSIVGPSVERAFGAGSTSRRAVELFARNVVRANERLLGPLEMWSLAGVERSDAGVIVRFEHAGDAHGVLALLLDPDGLLVEIAHHGGL